MIDHYFYLLISSILFLSCDPPKSSNYVEVDSSFTNSVVGQAVDQEVIDSDRGAAELDQGNTEPDRGGENDQELIELDQDSSETDLGSIDLGNHDSMRSDIGVDPDQGVEACESVYLDEFITTLWPRIFQARCIACHNPQGIAQDTRLSLVTESEQAETWASDNLEQVITLAQTQVDAYEQRALLELKPSGTMPHGGAVVLSPNGLLHQQLVDFVNRVQEQGDSACRDPNLELPTEAPYYEGVLFIEPQALLRRLVLSFAKRLPNEAEEDLVDSEGLDGVASVFDQVMNTEAFIERVVEGFDDIFMTRGYTAVNGAVLSYAFFPTRHWHQSLYVPPESYAIVNQYDEALRREPMELIAHIVRNELPFTEILTADYAMLSPFTARGYGVFEDIADQFNDPTDPFEYIPSTLPPRVHRNGQVQTTPDGVYPHAGILTTPQFLHRYPSTDTNRNRARARRFFKLFLGFDIMTSAPEVSDSAAVTARFDNPTMEAPECVSCHQMIDPIAGLFQDYNNDGEFHFRSEPWFSDMFAPGYEGTNRPDVDAGRALQWLGQQSAQDERFATAMAEHAYYILTQEPLLSPPQAADDHFQARLRGYQAQREAIQDAALAFRTGGYHFKDLMRSLAFSEFYRADGLSEDVDAERLIEFSALGLGALLTPEQLLRKVKILFGTTIGIDRNDPDQRRSSYLLYGGIDFKEVTERAVSPNGAMGALMVKHANHLACRVALKEFWLENLEPDSAGPYSFFPFVDEDSTDEHVIRRNLVHLHKLILGQRLDSQDADISRSYDLFNSVRLAGVERVMNGEDQRLIYDCRREQTVPNDADYVMRSWQAIITYLLRRPEFLLQ